MPFLGPHGARDHMGVRWGLVGCGGVEWGGSNTGPIGVLALLCLLGLLYLLLASFLACFCFFALLPLLAWLLALLGCFALVHLGESVP